MGKMVINPDIISEGTEKFSAHYNMVKEVAGEYIELDFDLKGRHFDGRDFIDIALWFKPEGKSVDEKKQSIRAQYKNMLDAFASGDENKYGQYLDMVFNSFEKIPDFYANGINTIDDFMEICALGRVGQCVAVKRNEYPDWFFNRYNNLEKANKFFEAQTMQEVMASDLLTLSKNNPSFNFPSGMDLELYGPYGYDMYRHLADGIVKARRAGDNKNISIKIPARLREEARKNFDDMTETGVSPNQMLIYANITPTVAKDIGYKDNGLSTPNFKNSKLIFLDGESMYDIAKRELQGIKKFKNNPKLLTDLKIDKMAWSLYYKSMVKGDKVVSVAIPNKNDKGQTVFSLRKLKPDVSEVKDSIMNEHTWFRKTFFNWGPFKIDAPDQAKIDALYARSEVDDNKIINRANKIYFDEIKVMAQEMAISNEQQENSPTYEAILKARESNKCKAQLFLDGVLKKGKGNEILHDFLDDSLQEDNNVISTSKKGKEINDLEVESNNSKDWPEELIRIKD